MQSLKIIEYHAQATDAEIVKRILKGEKELYEILLRRNNQTLYRVIRSYLKDENDVQDAMQEAYLKAYDKLQQFQGNATFSTWLIRIGINEALLQLRSNKKIRPLYATEHTTQSDTVLQIPDATQMNPERKIILNEMKIVIEKAIDLLPEKYRIVYVLKEVEGLDIGEIGNCLDLSDNNVKVRLHRAKALLKDSLYNLSSGTEIFQFGSSKCDRLVSIVMNRI